MLERWLHVCFVKITFGILPNELVRFHKSEFDKMRYKLNPTEYARSCEPNHQMVRYVTRFNP